MKKSLTAVMKQIKALEEQKARWISEEDETSTVSYVGKEDRIETGYDYDATRTAIAEIDDEILRLRSALAKTNAVTKLADFDYTVAEALVRLAQMSAQLRQLQSLPTVQSSRQVTFNGTIEYTERLYDVARVKKEIETLRARIADLQMALDKTNLTYEIDV